MSTATISGTITHSVATGGPSVALYVGAPDVNPTTTTSTITFTEKCSTTIAAGVSTPVTVSFGTITAASLLYIGTDEAIEVKLNGGSEVFEIEAGGFILIKGGSMDGAVIEATTSAATVEILILGEQS